MLTLLVQLCTLYLANLALSKYLKILIVGIDNLYFFRELNIIPNFYSHDKWIYSSMIYDFVYSLKNFD